ncbi:MAG: ATP phosphoribosyltransferase [Deltaproteobacteria bacterium]|nr:ATP phosphoribosyltransferase [Deltaproteobacteria bacterium]
MQFDALSQLRLALPKGRMQAGVFALLADAGIDIQAGSGERAYRPRVNLPGVETKLLKPQNIVEMLAMGSRDIGFAGGDWVAEIGAEVVELLDTALDPVRIVAATLTELSECIFDSTRPLVVASEYENLTRKWIAAKGLKATFVRSFGATEAFPPEDADCIVDCTATGSTLKANNLAIVDELMVSSTRLYAYPRALDIPHKREAIEHFILLVKSALEARTRVMIELNVSIDKLEVMAKMLPCMRRPTVSPLQGNEGYAIKSAVPKHLLPDLIPQIKKLGGTDIVITKLAQIVP